MPDLLSGEASYSGNESYRYVDKLIRSSGDLDIVSPYISLMYAKMLARHARKHRVRFITSGSRQNDAAIRYFRKVAKPYLAWMKSASFVLLLCVAAFSLGFNEALQLLVLVFLALAAICIFKYKKGFKNLNVKISIDLFIHEKIYLSKEAAIVGSANLTYSGLHKNIEHIEVVVSRKKLDALSEHFNRLWSSLD